MYKSYLTILVLFLMFVGNVFSQKISHEKFDRILKKHVTDDGLVNYKDLLMNRKELDEYLDDLAKNSPTSDWKQEDEIAYWINAYNAFTIDLILDYYPVKSINDIDDRINNPMINSAWDKEFIEIEGHDPMDLNHIEHTIMEDKFQDARLHFVLVCASRSCPKLPREAFTGDKLEDMLEKASEDFINDPFRNTIKSGKMSLSEIFHWYRRDFEKESTSLVNYINKYSEVRVRPNASIHHHKYDWHLNEYAPE